MGIPKVTKVSESLGAGHKFKYTEFLRRKFTLQSKFGETVELYRREGDYIYVPAQCAKTKLDLRSQGAAIQVSSSFKPRSREQEDIANISSQLLRDGCNHILEATTGFGKTVVGTEIAGRLGRKILVVVPKSDIIEHWHKAMQMVLNLKPQEVGLIRGDTCNVAGKKACIALIQSIHKPGRYPDWVYKEFGTTIFDECHTVSAKFFSNCMWLIPSMYRLGLSATPDRADGKDFVFLSHIGPVAVSSQSFNLVPRVVQISCAYTIPTKKVWMDVQGVRTLVDAKTYVKPGRTNGVNSALAKSEKRNRLIASIVRDAYKAGRKTIVFSDLRDSHLGPIETAIMSLGVPQQSIAWYVGGLTKKQREVAKKKPIILSTYKMASMATDIPPLDTCVLATPRTDVTQPVGRILRTYSDKQEPLVFDIVDVDCPLFIGYAKKRRKWYNKIGADIKNTREG